jgi:hypothetical protein
LTVLFLDEGWQEYPESQEKNHRQFKIQITSKKTYSNLSNKSTYYRKINQAE